MELLLNGLMRQGAHRDRLEAKVFGGARMMSGLSDIGAKNAEFAKRFPAPTRASRSSAATPAAQHGRRMQFWPVSGRARQLFVAPQPKLAAAEAARAGAITTRGASTGDMELFS